MVDQERGRDLATTITEKENLLNITRVLNDANTKYELNPELVVCDLSPAMIAATSNVYGEDVVGIDGFHVMQELNNGIRRDLLDFRDKHFRHEIREFVSLRDGICAIQVARKNDMTGVDLSGIIDATTSITCNHGDAPFALEFTRNALGFLNINDYARFFKDFTLFLSEHVEHEHLHVKEFASAIMDKLPKSRFTIKGMNRVKTLVLQKLKTLYIKFRGELEERNKQFYKDHWTVFFQPERLTPARHERLDAFLARYPELEIYRRMTLQVGEIYRLPPDSIDGHQVRDLQEHAGFSDRLNTAIRTMQKHADKILRFVDVFKRHPGLPKRCRASAEWLNPRFKNPFKAGNNLVKKERLLHRLKAQMDGVVEWHLVEETAA